MRKTTKKTRRGCSNCRAPDHYAKTCLVDPKAIPKEMTK